MGRAALQPVSVVGDDYVQSWSDPPELDQSNGGRCMPVDVGQRLLHDAKYRALHPRRQFVDLAVRPQLNDQPRAIGKVIDVLLQTEAEPLRTQRRRMQQISKIAQFLDGFPERPLKIVPRLLLF